MRTVDSDRQIIWTMILTANLEEPVCLLLSRYCKLRGYETHEAIELKRDFRRISNANIVDEGYTEYQDWHSLPQTIKKSIRLNKLKEFLKVLEIAPSCLKT
jgi:hypothetical protein